MFWESEDNGSKYCSVDFSVTSDYATLITKPSLSFLSLSLSSNGFPVACFLCFLFQKQNHHKETCDREVGDIVVRIVDERRVIIHGSILVELFRIKTCVCIRLGQVAKLRDACAEWRMSCAFSRGKYGKNVWTGLSVTSQSGMVSWCPCRNSRDGWNMRKGEGEMENKDTCANTFLQTLEPWAMRVCDTHEKCAKYAVSALCA